MLIAIPQQSALHELAALLRCPPYRLPLGMILMVCQWTFVVAVILCGVGVVKPEPWTILGLIVGMLLTVGGTVYAEKNERQAAVASLQTAVGRAEALPGCVPQQLELLRAALGAWAARCTPTLQRVEARLDAMPF